MKNRYFVSRNLIGQLKINVINVVSVPHMIHLHDLSFDLILTGQKIISPLLCVSLLGK